LKIKWRKKGEKCQVHDRKDKDDLTKPNESLVKSKNPPTPENWEDLAEWKKLNKKAKGSIALHLHNTIAFRFEGEVTAWACGVP